MICKYNIECNRISPHQSQLEIPKVIRQSLSVTLFSDAWQFNLYKKREETFSMYPCIYIKLCRTWRGISCPYSNNIFFFSVVFRIWIEHYQLILFILPYILLLLQPTAPSYSILHCLPRIVPNTKTNLIFSWQRQSPVTAKRPVWLLRGCVTLKRPVWLHVWHFCALHLPSWRNLDIRHKLIHGPVILIDFLSLSIIKKIKDLLWFDINMACMNHGRK